MKFSRTIRPTGGWASRTREQLRGRCSDSALRACRAEVTRDKDQVPRSGTDLDVSADLLGTWNLALDTSARLALRACRAEVTRDKGSSTKKSNRTQMSLG